MSGNRRQDLPIRTLHDFLMEINDEWSKLKNGSLLSIITTITLFVLFIPRYFLVTLRQRGFLDTFIALGIIIVLLYTIYLAYQQFQFYQRWERRLGLLLHIEEKLLGA